MKKMTNFKLYKSSCFRDVKGQVHVLGMLRVKKDCDNFTKKKDIITKFNFEIKMAKYLRKFCLKKSFT